MAPRPASLLPLLGLVLSHAIPALATPTPFPILRRSPLPLVDNGKFIVRDVGSFANTQTFVFNETNSLPEGLYASDYQITGDGTAPYTHRFSPDNVGVSGGYLELRVPGGQSSSPISTAQVETTFTNIKYASVRTVAILSRPAGTCNGMFFYQSDAQEVDIEWLSDPSSNPNGGQAQIFYTNQDANGDGSSTYTSKPPPSDATSAEHEYRIDWTEGEVVWYLDGVEQFRSSKDVPTEAGPWLWNNWSNGGDGWTAGPPQEDSVFRIKEITMYYNTAHKKKKHPGCHEN